MDVVVAEVDLLVGQLDGKPDDHVDIGDYFLAELGRNTPERHALAVGVSDIVEETVLGFQEAFEHLENAVNCCVLVLVSKLDVSLS